MSTLVLNKTPLRALDHRGAPEPPLATRTGLGVPVGAAWPELAFLAGVGLSRRYGPYRVRTIQAPAAALDRERADVLRAMCIRGSRLAFGIDMSPYWRARPRYFDELSEWSVADYDGELAGWHGLAVWPAECGTILYTDMLVTLPGHRRSGLD